MTSKLIVNSLAADTGVSTITFADQAKMGNSLFHSTGFTIGDSFLHSTGVNLTNINATGVITATKFVGEVSVGSSITFEDNEKAYFGTGTDFSIYHNGSASYLDETGTGGLIAKTNTAFQVFNSAGSQPAFTVTPGGSVELYHGSTKKIESASYGALITGQCYVSHSGTTPGFSLSDNGRSAWGASDDLQIFHSAGAASHINATGLLNIDGTTGVRLEYNNSTRVDCTSSGVSLVGDVDVADTIKHTGDTDTKIRFPAGDEIQFETGGSTRLHIGSGNITQTIDTDGEGLIITAGDMKPMLTGNSNRSAHNNTIFGISGKWNNTEIGRIAFEAGPDTTNKDDGKIRFYTRPSGGSLTKRFEIVDDGKITVAADSDIRFTNGTWTGEVAGKIQHNSNNLYIQGGTGGIRFRHASSGVNQFSMTNGGNFEITNGDLVVANGHGIDFSANTDGGGTSTATLLEDYEEGSYTITSNTNLTLDNNRTGYYTKVGNMVTVTGYLSLNTNDGSPSVSGSNNIVLSLPYAVNTSSGTYTGTMLQQNIDSDTPTSTVGHPLWYKVLPVDYVCMAGYNGLRFYINYMEAAYTRMNNSHLHVGYPGYTYIAWNITYRTN